MVVKEFTPATFKPLSSVYVPDSKVKFNERIFFSENNVAFPMSQIFYKSNDNAINNFSNLFLTRNDTIESNIYVENLDPLPDEGFSTYLVANALLGINTFSRFWVVDEPDIDIKTAAIALTGRQEYIDNRYFFDITFLDDKFCKISHEHLNVTRYLTVDYLGNLVFCKDSKTDYLGRYSPQVFYYLYDRDSDYIVFYKNVNDIAKYLIINEQEHLTLSDPVTGFAVPFDLGSIFKCIKRSDPANISKIYDTWVSYEKTFKTNSTEIDSRNSYTDLKSNLLVNSEFYAITGNELPVNILSLKNTFTPDHLQAKNAPFYDEDLVNFRDYKKIFSGSRQNYGNDNISLGFETFSTKILIKNDKITYFHMPTDMYPFDRINIRDAGLIEAGATAADHPLKSDLIFKKRGDYKNSSYFGNSIDEQTGDFLCSWLSGNGDINSRPIWVDRYYNPKKVSFYNALTADNFKAMYYIQEFDCRLEKIPNTQYYDVFDVPSAMVFEPGCYYAYYKIGAQGVQQRINALQKNLVQRNLNNFKSTNNIDVFEVIEPDVEYVFNGDRYSLTESLSTIGDSSEFTIIFDLYSNDWTEPFGNQIIGNLDKYGFSIYNYVPNTSLLFLASNNELNIANTDFQSLRKVNFEQNIKYIFKTYDFTDYHILFENGSIKKYNANNVEVVSKIIDGTPSDIKDFDIYGHVVLMLSANDSGPFGRQSRTKIDIYGYNLLTDEQYDNLTKNFNSIRFTPGVSFTKNISSANTIHAATVENNDIIFITDGDKAERRGEQIYYLKDNNIMYWNLSTNNVQTVHSANKINDFSLDLDGYIWALNNNTNYVKIDPGTYSVVFSGIFVSDFKNQKINFISEFEKNDVNDRVIFTRANSLSSNIIEYIIMPINSNTYTTTYVTGATGAFGKITNSEYMREYIRDHYPASSLNVKAVVATYNNYNDIILPEIKFDLKQLDPGYHNFAVRFNCNIGQLDLFVDGMLTNTTRFMPAKYTMKEFIHKPFLVGSSGAAYSIPLFKYLKKKTNLAEGIKLKNFYLYNKALLTYDVINHSKVNMKIRDINFHVPCGKKNFVEEIERFFKFKIPGHKSNVINLNINNSRIIDTNLKSDLEAKIRDVASKLIPAHVRLNKINWNN
jgi:hypothetical protein